MQSSSYMSKVLSKKIMCMDGNESTVIKIPP